MTKLRMPTAVPAAKLQAATMAGAISTVLIFILDQFGIEMDAETAVAFTTLIMFVAGYFKRPSERDNPVAQ